MQWHILRAIGAQSQTYLLPLSPLGRFYMEASQPSWYLSLVRGLIFTSSFNTKFGALLAGLDLARIRSLYFSQPSQEDQFF